MRRFVALLFLTAGISCYAETGLQVGAERLDEYLPALENKSVAMMVNQSSLVGDQHLVDVL